MEEMTVFGSHSNLVGWICQAPDCRWRKTAVVMLTPGMLHHIGPMRLHVELARHLAAAGISSFRFDLSGIGESLAVASQGSSLQRASNEISAALDWLGEHHQLEQFILFGLCSGADDALAAACDDRRVIGLCMMDGCGFRTRAFYWHWFQLKYLPKLLSGRKWLDLLKSRLLPSESGASSMPLGQDIREFGSPEICQTQIQNLLKRGVKMQWIYTGGTIDYYSYADQFFDMFPEIARQDSLQVHHLPMLDHLATLRQDREELLALIQQWCTTFPTDALAVASPVLPLFNSSMVSSVSGVLS